MDTLFCPRNQPHSRRAAASEIFPSEARRHSRPVPPAYRYGYGIVSLSPTVTPHSIAGAAKRREFLPDDAAQRHSVDCPTVGTRVAFMFHGRCSSSLKKEPHHGARFGTVDHSRGIRCPDRTVDFGFVGQGLARSLYDRRGVMAWQSQATQRFSRQETVPCFPRMALTAIGCQPVESLPS